MDEYTPQRAFRQEKDHARAPRLRKTRPCRHELCVAIGPCVPQGLQSCNQMPSLNARGREEDSYNLVRGAFNIRYEIVSI